MARVSSIRIALLLLLATAVAAEESNTTKEERPEFKPISIKAPFFEQFSANSLSDRWHASEATKVTKEGGETWQYVGEWKVEEPSVFPGLKNDLGLVVKSAAAHHAISAPLEVPLDNNGKTLVLQYEAKFQNGLNCGGAYIKLLTESPEGIHFKEFNDKTPYTIMFGPDKCGATDKVHFIFRHKKPDGKYEEKHLTGAPSARISKLSTLYTLIVRPDNTFEILIDNESVKKGSLLEDFNPPVNPPKEIDDPEDKKPADWVDEARIPDPDAKKPDDWIEDLPMQIPDEDATKPDDWLEDEPEMIPDPDAKKPDDWDDEEDGDFIAPEIPNPKCQEAAGCGPWKRPMKANPDYKPKWTPPMIDNPAYKGEWKPRKISNPDYFEDKHPANFERIAAVGFELWTMQNQILFDNIYLGHSVEDAKRLAEEVWKPKHAIEKEAEDKEFGVKSAEDQEAPDYKQDPIGFARHHVTRFVEAARRDPTKAVQDMPVVAGVVGLFAAIFLGVLASIVGLVAPKSKPAAPHKKTDEPTPDDKDADKEETVKEKKEKSESSGVQKRAAKKAQDDE
ncbi:uncharacterized protein VTP21DRAFT_424 [Calcarisporiella thermophila]|uniref:uncharacterized protein n=1 Tax=Calcarisporiella thermophila TaxID=911321 RepID=UPI003742BFEF